MREIGRNSSWLCIDSGVIMMVASRVGLSAPGFAATHHTRQKGSTARRSGVVETAESRSDGSENR